MTGEAIRHCTNCEHFQADEKLCFLTFTLLENPEDVYCDKHTDLDSDPFDGDYGPIKK